MKILKFAREYLLLHKTMLVIFILFSIIATAISVASPYITGSFLDNLITEADFNSVLQFCILFGILSICNIVINHVSSIIYIKMQTSMGFKLNRHVISHIQNLSLSYIGKYDAAYLTQRVSRDASEIILFSINFLRNFIVHGLMFIVPFFILFNINWVIGVALIFFLSAYTAFYFVFKKPLYKSDLCYKEKQNSFFARIYEQLIHTKLIKLTSIQPEMLGRLDEAFGSVRDSAVRKQRLGNLFSSTDGIISTLAQISLFVVGGVMILNGNFTIGMFTIFASYFNMMISSCRYFFNLSAYYQQTLVAFDRISEILSEKSERCGSERISDINKINLDGVGFNYGNKVIVNNLSLEFRSGSIYGIVGSNGTGKSTLINLIMGMYIDEREGKITYNNLDIKNVDMV